MRSVVGLGCLLVACGGGNGPGVPDSGPAEIPASGQHIVAFEGQGAFVESLTVAGVDLTGAHVEVQPGSPLELVDSRCNNARCGAVARVRDTIPNRGVSIPAPIDTENVFLVVVDATGTRHRGLVSVNPLDTITGAGTTPLTIGSPVLLAASAEASSGSVFLAPPGAQPLRWVIFGDASLHGTLDLRGGDSPAPDVMGRRAGGFAGGGVAADGQGAAGGSAGLLGAGGGGGGHVTAGVAGEGADGTADAGGAGGSAAGVDACLSDFSAADCGGSGGGGSTMGAGGAGGGAALLVSLGNLDLSGAELLATGADGTDGGGGGAGGALILAGRGYVAGATLDVEGGQGGGAPVVGGAGGAGGRGLLRVDAAGAEATDQGPTFDLSTFSPLVEGTSITLSGWAAADSDVVVSVLGTIGGVSAHAGADGHFSIDVALDGGLNRLTLTQDVGGVTLRSWSGTSIELGRVGSSSLALPLGGALDVVSLPAVE